MPKVEIGTERARVLNRLLDEALDRPSTDRMAWVETLSADVADLKPHLRNLLTHAAEIETGHFLGALPRFALPKIAMDAGERAPQPGVMIGPYRLLHELGQGGMGSVWLAERIDGLLARRVALKLPHGSWSHGGLAERLLRERD